MLPSRISLLCKQLAIGIIFICAASNLVASEEALNQSPSTNQYMQHTVKLETTKGVIEIRLFADKAPISVENFVQYVTTEFYDGLIFHRVIPGFMIQGGGFDENLVQRATRTTIKNEADNGLTNKRGTLAMARTSIVDSATSQFFINLADNDFLNHGERDFGYAVFAEVASGMEIVDAIAAVPTGRNGPHSDVPKEQIVILRATVE